MPKTAATPATIEAQLTESGFSPCSPDSQEALRNFAGDEDTHIEYARPVYPGVTQSLHIYQDGDEVVIDIDTIFKGTIENEDGDANLYLDDIGETESRVVEECEFTAENVNKMVKSAIWTLNFDRTVAKAMMLDLRDKIAPQPLVDIFKEYGIATSARAVKALEKAEAGGAKADKSKDTGR